MIRRILNIYRFTNSEKRSLILLLFLLVLINLFGFLLRSEPEVYSSNNIPAVLSTSNRSYSEPEGSNQTESRAGNVVREDIKKTVEINSADSITFLSLYGIGPVFAGRIIKYRNLLGGYFRCEQLLEVYGMDTIRYNGFCSGISCDKAVVKQININTAGFKDLLRHPYLDYENVKLIVNFRDRHGPILSPEILWKDSVLSEDLKPRLMPYINSKRIS